MIKLQIHEQTEKTLEIENILTDFNFLNTFDDEDTSKTIDSGFEGEQQTKQIDNYKSNINQTMNTIFVDIIHRILILLHVRFILYLTDFIGFLIVYSKPFKV
jgi:hypothetical protein